MQDFESITLGALVTATGGVSAPLEGSSAPVPPELRRPGEWPDPYYPYQPPYRPFTQGSAKVKSYFTNPERKP